MTYIEEIWEATGGRTLLLPSAGLIALDRSGRLLLQRRSDDGTWGLTGGFLEIGETPEDAIRREAREELDLELGDLELLGVFAGPDCFHDYPDRGRVYSVNVVYVARDLADRPRSDDAEVQDVRFFDPHELPANLEQVTHLVLDRYLKAQLS